jgi:solute carrier family 35 protein F5
MFLKHAWDDRHTLSKSPTLSSSIRDLLPRRVGRYKLLRDHESATSLSSKSRTSTLSDADELLLGDPLSDTLPSASTSQSEGLTLADTVKLSFEFCILWFLANYFAAACLEYTTVASSTILASTSSIFTLLFGSILRVERFTLRKMLGVCASLLGVILISSVDVSGDTDSHRGDFPHKTPGELALGDGMAFLSAVLYGFYAVFMKKRIGDESKVNMPLFFGLVGLFNILLLWPGLIILHLTSIEPFTLPPSRKILVIVLVNSASSLVSDFCWAYAMLLTSPLIVTVGLSLTIPLSLVGQMVLDRQYASALYWVGALVMVGGFLFVNQAGEDEEGPSSSSGGAGGAGAGKGNGGYTAVGAEEQSLGLEGAGPSSRGDVPRIQIRRGSKDV